MRALTWILAALLSGFASLDALALEFPETCSGPGCQSCEADGCIFPKPCFKRGKDDLSKASPAQRERYLDVYKRFSESIQKHHIREHGSSRDWTFYGVPMGMVRELHKTGFITHSFMLKNGRLHQREAIDRRRGVDRVGPTFFFNQDDPYEFKGGENFDMYRDGLYYIADFGCVKVTLQLVGWYFCRSEWVDWFTWEKKGYWLPATYGAPSIGGGHRASTNAEFQIIDISPGSADVNFIENSVRQSLVNPITQMVVEDLERQTSLLRYLPGFEATRCFKEAFHSIDADERRELLLDGSMMALLDVLSIGTTLKIAGNSVPKKTIAGLSMTGAAVEAGRLYSEYQDGKELSPDKLLRLLAFTMIFQEHMRSRPAITDGRHFSDDYLEDIVHLKTLAPNKKVRLQKLFDIHSHEEVYVTFNTNGHFSLFFGGKKVHAPGPLFPIREVQDGGRITSGVIFQLNLGSAGEEAVKALNSAFEAYRGSWAHLGCTQSGCRILTKAGFTDDAGRPISYVLPADAIEGFTKNLRAPLKFRGQDVQVKMFKTIDSDLEDYLKRVVDCQVFTVGIYTTAISSWSIATQQAYVFFSDKKGNREVVIVYPGASPEDVRIESVQ